MGRAEFGLVDDAFQVFKPLRERPFQVFPEKEIRVGEACPEDPLMTFSDHGFIPRYSVVHGHEIGHEASLVVIYRKIFLVFPHGGNEDGRREIQEGRIKAAAYCGRIFHEVGDDSHQGRVPGRSAAHGRRRFPNQALHLALPFSRVDHHAGVRHLPEVVRHIRDLPGLRRHEAVPPGHVPARHTRQIKGDHLPVKKGDHPVDGPDKWESDIPPPHGFGPRQGADRFRQCLRQDLGGGFSGTPAFHIQVFPLRCIYALKVFNGDALFTGEPHGRLRGPALGVIGHIPGGARQFLNQVLLAFGNGLSDQNQAPGGPVGKKPACHLDPVLFQGCVGQPP